MSSRLHVNPGPVAPVSIGAGLQGRCRVRGVLWVLLSFCCVLGRASTDALPLLAQTGYVLLLRHANAPGVGDPPKMVLSDCATQRNLDERGRSQARKIGERLRGAGVKAVRVYTSQWCRCRETARLLDIGPVEELTALNSFFEDPAAKASRLAALRAFVDQLPRDGRTVVFVTHQVTITALTGFFPESGEGLVLKLLVGGGFERAAELPSAE